MFTTLTTFLYVFYFNPTVPLSFLQYIIAFLPQANCWRRGLGLALEGDFTAWASFQQGPQWVLRETRRWSWERETQGENSESQTCMSLNWSSSHFVSHHLSPQCHQISRQNWISHRVSQISHQSSMDKSIYHVHEKALWCHNAMRL